MQISEVNLQSKFQGSQAYLVSEENHRKQKAGEDVIEHGMTIQPQQVANLGSVGHLVMPLESGIGERDCRLSLHD